MSAGKNLFVGCRVRILYSVSFPEIAGGEGTIIRQLPPGIESTLTPGVELHWEVSVDSWGGSMKWQEREGRNVRFCPNSDQLEPILPNGLESNEQIDKLYQPDLSGVKEKEKVYVRIKK